LGDTERPSGIPSSRMWTRRRRTLVSRGAPVSGASIKSDELGLLPRPGHRVIQARWAATPPVAAAVLGWGALGFAFPGPGLGSAPSVFFPCAALTFHRRVVKAMLRCRRRQHRPPDEGGLATPLPAAGVDGTPPGRGGCSSTARQQHAVRHGQLHSPQAAIRVKTHWRHPKAPLKILGNVSKKPPQATFRHAHTVHGFRFGQYGKSLRGRPGKFVPRVNVLSVSQSM
jgi:hypothetical protein